jgi:hypothetical protein
MRRREAAPVLVAALVGAVVVGRALTHGGAHSSALRIAVLALIVAAILYTRMGPRAR